MESAAARTRSATPRTSVVCRRRTRAPVRTNVARSQTIVIGTSSAGLVPCGSARPSPARTVTSVSTPLVPEFAARASAKRMGNAASPTIARTLRYAKSRHARAISVSPRTNPTAPRVTTATRVPRATPAKLGSVPAATRSSVAQLSARFPERAIQGPAAARTRRTSPTARRARPGAPAATGSAAPVVVAVMGHAGPAGCS